MPYKHNIARQHKYKKARYKVTNGSEYNEALRRRGDITIWLTDEAIEQWHPSRTGARGRPLKYSAVAIQTMVFVGQVYHLPLRQTQGLMRAMARAFDSDIVVPDYSTISKRSVDLPRVDLLNAINPGSRVIVDSSGLKVFGKDEWHQEKHGVVARRTWRKLHIAVDEFRVPPANLHELVA